MRTAVVLLNLLTFISQAFSLENKLELACHHKNFLELHENLTQLPCVQHNDKSIKMGLKPLYPQLKKEIQKHLHTENTNTVTTLSIPMSNHLNKMMAKQAAMLGKYVQKTKVPPYVSINGFSTCTLQDQGNVGACTAFAFAYIVKVLKGLWISQRYQYANTCMTEDQLTGLPEDPESYLQSDPGATLLGSLFTFSQNNATPQTITLPVSLGSISSTYTGCKYNSDQSNFADILPPFAQHIALKLSKIGSTTNPYLTLNQNLKYSDLFTPYANSKGVIPTANQAAFAQAMVSAMQARKMIYVGVMVYSSFMNAAHGLIPMPTSKDQLAGGHALTVGAYTNKYMSDSTYGTFQFINSWGNAWGDKGFGYFPVQYLMNYAVEIYAVGL